MDAADCAPRRAPARVLLGAVRVGGVGRGPARGVHKAAAADTGVAGTYNIFAPFMLDIFPWPPPMFLLPVLPREEEEPVLD